jgi:Nodulation protein Z (NodZ)
VLGVEIRSTVGLGAKLEWCLEIMAYCDDRGLLPQFRFSYPDARVPADHFGSLFSIRDARDGPARFVTISSIVELDLGEDYDRVLTIDRASHLIRKYLVVKDNVIEEVDDFCRRHFAERRVLGVHYRGTDKVVESPFVPYDRVRRNIDRYLELYPNTDRVFVATDDARFLDYMQNASLGRGLLCREDSFRSRDGSSIHESSETNKHAINRDAIVNCRILSRCEALLKTASILSAWSKLFNPRLPVVMLNRPPEVNLWFPERVLVGENLFEPLE